MNVALLDYGAGNLHSLKKGLEAGGAEVTVTTAWDVALALDALILPGVGSFGQAVGALGQEQERIRRALEAGLPALGICLGMQLFFETSQEGSGRGIGFFSGEVRRLSTPVIPQMGWNDVALSDDPLFRGLEGLVAYYANSFVCAPEEDSSTIATTEYMGDTFPAAVRRGSTWGVQFHPEKSSSPGLRIIRKFLEEVQKKGGPA